MFQNIGLCIKFLFSMSFICTMDIKNITKKRIIAENVAICKNIIAKSLGLMFTLNPKTLIFIFKKEK